MKTARAPTTTFCILPPESALTGISPLGAMMFELADQPRAILDDGIDIQQARAA